MIFCLPGASDRTAGQAVLPAAVPHVFPSAGGGAPLRAPGVHLGGGGGGRFSASGKLLFFRLSGKLGTVKNSSSAQPHVSNTKQRKHKNSSSARPHGGEFICQNSVVTGAGRFGTSRLELNVESNFRCDQMGRSLKFRSSDQLCAPSVKLYVGLSSLSEIFLASWGMKLIISSVPPDMRFSRRRFLRFAGQPAFPACPYHLGHMVIGVALADSISAFEVIALIVHWSFLPCEIALKLHRFTCTLE